MIFRDQVRRVHKKKGGRGREDFRSNFAELDSTYKRI